MNLMLAVNKKKTEIINLKQNKMEIQNDKWGRTFKKRLPMLALVAPLCFFIASVVRAFGIGTLPGDLNWVSSYEGLIMGIGAPFFVAMAALTDCTASEAFLDSEKRGWQETRSTGNSQFAQYLVTRRN